MKKEKVCTICLMRKGSKRFPGKNTAMFMGKPLYQHTIEFGEKLGFDYYFAHDFRGLDDCLCDYPFLKIIKRDSKYTQDQHNTAQEILSFNLNYDVFILLQVTSPLRDLMEYAFATEKFLNHPELSCGVAVSPVPGLYYNSYYKAINYNVRLRNYFYAGQKELYKETGAFYIFRKSQLQKNHILNCKKEELIFIHDKYNVDIDTKKNLKLAELKCKHDLF